MHGLVQLWRCSRSNTLKDHRVISNQRYENWATCRSRWRKAEKLEMRAIWRQHTATKEAEKLEVQVMETLRPKLMANHPHTLTSMANLAFSSCVSHVQPAVTLLNDG